MKTALLLILLLLVLILAGCSRYGMHHYYRHGLIFDQTGQNHVRAVTLLGYSSITSP